jgi:hypothetical protein
MSIGFYEGDTCNRDGCDGVIEKDRDEITTGCSCHLTPPCGYCTAMEICPKCDWSAEEEADAEAAKHPKPKPSTWEYKRKTIDDLDKSKIDWYISDSWHSGMEVTGVYPEGTKMQDILTALRVSENPNMPRFKRFGDGIFIVRYFTD